MSQHLFSMVFAMRLSKRRTESHRKNYLTQKANQCIKSLI